MTANAGDDARFELPVGETVSIEVTAFDVVKTVGRPPAQSVVVPAGTPARVEFRVPTIVGLRLVAPGVASRGKTTARAFLWRLPPGQSPVYADSADGDLGEGIPFTVSPGPYGVQLTDVRGYLPSWTVFVVSPEADPNVVAVEPGAAAEGAQLRLQEADGAPAANESVWIGRLGGASPSEVAVGNGKSDADGMVSLATLPDGDYRIAVRGQHWHAIELRAGAPVPTLRLPPRSTPSGGDAPAPTRISGLVVAPDGGSLRDVFVVLYDLPDGWGRYTGFDPTGAFTFGDVTPGDVTIEVPWSQLRTQVHEPARVSLRIAPGNHRFVVIEAWRVQHGTR